MALALRQNVPLAPLTTFKAGGAARFFCAVEHREALREALSWAKERGLPWWVLGRGSNVLVADAGHPGLTLRLSGGFCGAEVDPEAATVRAGAGFSLIRLGLLLADLGQWDARFMALIPGTVGGAVRMNAGMTLEGDMAAHVVSATVLSPEGGVETWDAERLAFGYRASALSTRPDVVVLYATLRLSPNRRPAREVREAIRRIGASRKAAQPKVSRNFGSTFKKPCAEKSAGWFIEQAGLKGRIAGGAQISPEHANWIVNLGDAATDDARRLIDLARDEVLARFGVTLEREVIYAPEDFSEAP